MHMGYYEGEKSVELFPIVIACGLVVMLGFGMLYIMFGHQLGNQGDAGASYVEESMPQAQQPIRESQTGKDSERRERDRV